MLIIVLLVVGVVEMIKKTESGFKTIFKDCRIAALAGEKSSGKSNNIIALIHEMREEEPLKNLDVFVYGFSKEVTKYLKKKLNCHEISSIKQLAKKKNCLVIIDEMQKLKLNDRRYKDDLSEFVDFTYHNNVYCLLSSPNIREFNSVIGSVVEKWLLKSVSVDDCINGSHLKKVVDEYKGVYKSLGRIEMPKNELLVVNNEYDIILECAYVEMADKKRDLVKIF